MATPFLVPTSLSLRLVGTSLGTTSQVWAAAPLDTLVCFDEHDTWQRERGQEEEGAGRRRRIFQQT